MDLRDGIVVRGVAGRREEYRAVQSLLADDAQPLTVARAFRDKLRLSRLYLADLDGIQHDSPHYGLYRALAADGFELLVDAGLRDVDAAVRIIDAGCAGVIAGLETSEGPHQLYELCAQIGAERLIFSLDLVDGRLLKSSNHWGTDDPVEVAAAAVAAGLRRMIVLDLSRVGTGRGLGTTALCARLRAEFSELAIIAGGGVRGMDDLRALCAMGVAGALLATTLHDGTIGLQEIQSLRSNVSG
jgi:phosphoribosylformimino-5-aminoimidazole carboxamide ribotide isomerase